MGGCMRYMQDDLGFFCLIRAAPKITEKLIVSFFVIRKRKLLLIRRLTMVMSCKNCIYFSSLFHRENWLSVFRWWIRFSDGLRNDNDWAWSSSFNDFPMFGSCVHLFIHFSLRHFGMWTNGTMPNWRSCVRRACCMPCSRVWFNLQLVLRIGCDGWLIRKLCKFVIEVQEKS